jgi:hypothetical protein
MPTVSVICDSQRTAETFVRQFGVAGADSRVLVHVRTKYFAADVWMVPGTDALSDADGVIYLADGIPLFTSASQLVLHALLPLSSSSKMQDRQRDACIANGCEFIESDDVFAAIDVSCGTSGLLGAEATGPSRVWQLLHQTMWPSVASAASATPSTPNCVLMIDVDDSVAAALPTVLQLSAASTLSNKYFSAELTLLRRTHHICSGNRDVLNAEFIRTSPSVLVFGSLASCWLYSGFVDASNVPCVYIAPHGVSASDLPSNFEAVSLAEMDFDPECGEQGAGRLREIFHCASWCDTVMTCGNQVNVASETPSAPAQAYPDEPMERVDAVFLAAGVSLEDACTFAQRALKLTTDSVRGTAEVCNAYGSSKISFVVKEMESRGRLCEDAHAVIVVAGDATVDVSGCFRASLVDFDPSVDERIRLVIGHAPRTNVCGLGADESWAVECIDTSDPEKCLNRVQEAISSCMWPSFVESTKLPQHLYFSCEPPPGFGVDGSGRTVRCEMAESASDDWERLATEMREQRASQANMDPNERKNRAETLAMRFASMLDS